MASHYHSSKLIQVVIPVMHVSLMAVGYWSIIVPNPNPNPNPNQLGGLLEHHRPGLRRAVEVPRKPRGR